MDDITITHFTKHDIRFPTSLNLDGSDAMHEAPDYSAAYILLHTNKPELVGHGMTFTLGRGNELVCACLQHLARHLVNRPFSTITPTSATWRLLRSDTQLRWVGPESGILHLALGAVTNALWDLYAKILNKPLWRVLSDMTPQELVDHVDFRYISDAVTPTEAVELLASAREDRDARLRAVAENRGVPVYTTSAGWMGYDEAKMEGLLTQAVAAGYKHFKMKVGRSVEDDRARLRLVRKIIGPDAVLMVDANQVWDVNVAIEHMKKLAEFKPWFIEEPTSPYDILGHKAIRDALEPHGIKVATGEMCANRILFKQFLSSGAIDICQLDACRLGGVNEVLAVLLLAKKFGVPVVPHSGGVGLPEMTQHLALVDYVIFDGKGRLLEFVEHLHEHFVDPSRVQGGWLTTPLVAGYSVQMKEDSFRKFEFPGGEFWRGDIGRGVIRQGEC